MLVLITGLGMMQLYRWRRRLVGRVGREGRGGGRTPESRIMNALVATDLTPSTRCIKGPASERIVLTLGPPIDPMGSVFVALVLYGMCGWSQFSRSRADA